MDLSNEFNIIVPFACIADKLPIHVNLALLSKDTSSDSYITERVYRIFGPDFNTNSL